ncbi:MAG: hypothetical protein AB1679_33825 [Actinomycetota bacterium]|jgi:hypothetical protein
MLRPSLAAAVAAVAMVTGGIGPARATAPGPGPAILAEGAEGGATPRSYETFCSAMPQLSAGAQRCTYTFRYTGGIDTFVVPPTTEPVEITAVGAPGAGPPGLRSRGATVTAPFTGLSGVPLLIVVGGDGRDDGYNGGGLGGGGGASDVRVGGAEFDHRIIVAGGGGGSGLQLVHDEALGTRRLVRVRGGDAGQPGLGSAGQPGSITAGGAGGGNEYAPGQAGAYGRGGAGASGYGGGGGGYYGGGGGGGCAGGDEYGPSPCLHAQPGSGGGGSSLLPPGGAFVVNDDPTPMVKITVTQYGWWAKP